MGLTWMHDFLFQSQEPLREWPVACLHFDPSVRETAEKQKFRQYTEKVGHVFFIASNLLKTMVCQKIQKNVKYYFYIRQNWRGMVLRKYTLADCALAFGRLAAGLRRRVKGPGNGVRRGQTTKNTIRQ